jgi:hypothetical protein
LPQPFALFLATLAFGFSGVVLFVRPRSAGIAAARSMTHKIKAFSFDAGSCDNRRRDGDPRGTAK